MLRKIKLYGQLAKVVGHRVLEAEVNTAAQAMRFLLVNWPELEKHMVDRYYKVIVGDWDLKEEELRYPTGQNEIKFIPVVGGAGGNTGRILLGVALIGAAIFVPGAAPVLGAGGFSAAAGTGAFAAAMAVGANMGMYLVLTGIAGALTPVETLPENEQDPRRSFSFSGIQNTSRAGVAVPVVYGEIITGSVTISAGVDTEQVQV